MWIQMRASCLKLILINKNTQNTSVFYVLKKMRVASEYQRLLCFLLFLFSERKGTHGVVVCVRKVNKSAELQIRGGFEDNSMIIFLISQLKK